MFVGLKIFEDDPENSNRLVIVGFGSIFRPFLVSLLSIFRCGWNGASIESDWQLCQCRGTAYPDCRLLAAGWSYCSFGLVPTLYHLPVQGPEKAGQTDQYGHVGGNTTWCLVLLHRR